MAPTDIYHSCQNPFYQPPTCHFANSGFFSDMPWYGTTPPGGHDEGYQGLHWGCVCMPYSSDDPVYHTHSFSPWLIHQSDYGPQYKRCTCNLWRQCPASYDPSGGNGCEFLWCHEVWQFKFNHEAPPCGAERDYEWHVNYLRTGFYTEGTRRNSRACCPLGQGPDCDNTCNAAWQSGRRPSPQEIQETFGCCGFDCMPTYDPITSTVGEVCRCKPCPLPEMAYFPEIQFSL